MKRETARVWAALGLSLALTAVWFLIVYKEIPFIYDINDDVAMRNVAAGVITGTPNAHLLHIKYVLGLLISGLYFAVPGFDWYGIVMAGIILFSFSLVLYRGLSEEKGILWKTGYAATAFLLMTCIGLQHVTAFQWTTTAAFAGASGIFLFYTAHGGPAWKTRLEELLSVILILTALLVRDDVFFMCLPAAFFCFCKKYVSLPRSADNSGRDADGGVYIEKPVRVKISRLYVPAAVLAGTALILAVEAAAYSSDEWREFRAYNTDREAIMDYYGIADYEDDPEFYDSLGLTEYEVVNIQRYSLYLTDDLYSDTMGSLAEREKELYYSENGVLKLLSQGIQKIYTHLGKDTYNGTNLICIFVTALTLGVCIGKKDRGNLRLAAVFILLWSAYWLYLGYRNRILERVGFALFLLAVFMMLAVFYRAVFIEGGHPAGPSGRGDFRSALPVLGAAVILTFMAVNIWDAVKSDNTDRSEYNLQFLEVNEYMAENSENVYFMTTFSIETYTDNFTVRRNFEFSNLLSLGGWHTFSPLENEKCVKLGINDSKTDIVESGGVYVISLENVNLRYMDRYYESIYGDAYIGRELVDTLEYGGTVFEVYKFYVEQE